MWSGRGAVLDRFWAKGDQARRPKLPEPLGMLGDARQEHERWKLDKVRNTVSR